MKRLLWIGSYVSGDALKEARKRGYVNPASVQSQINIVEGLEEVYGQCFDTIGALVLPPYPITKNRVFTEIDFSHTQGASDCLIGYTNKKYINKLSTKRNLCKKVREWANIHKTDSVEVFVYEMRSACLEAIKELKRIIPKARIYLIVPDIPVFMDLRMSKVKRLLKTIDWRIIQQNLPLVDIYILYAETMVDYLRIRKKKWMIMEGSINVKDIIELPINIKHNGKFVVMYSGHVEARFGLNNLVDAFKFLPSNYELWITGEGNAKEYIETVGEIDKRIKYYGFLPNREDLLQLQSEADLFVNMRNPEEKASHYCFPSKLFEYMLTGKPVLTCKLRGIPFDYFEYLITMKTISPIDIAQAILKVSNLSEEQRISLGEKTREYIINNKNNSIQAQNIKRFIEKMMGL